MNPIINLVPGDTLLHKLSGTTKVRLFILLIIYIMMSFDARLIFPLFFLSLIGLFSLKPKWKTIRWIIVIVLLMNAFNIFLYWLADPEVGKEYCNTSTVVYQFNSYLIMTKETLWYMFVRYFKMITSFLVSLVFIMSVTPSEFAAGLYSCGIPYKFCTIVELAFRYIPDISRDYSNISISMQCRGVEMDPKKVGLGARMKQMVLILVPLIITSFDRIGNIANAMDLRGFGKLKKRSYYSEHPETKTDKIFKVIYCILLVFIVVYCVKSRVWPSATKMWYPFR